MPFHKTRTWVVHHAESGEWLAEKLINHSWCSCAGWLLGGYLFLNDQTSDDGAFEVAVVKPPDEPGGDWWQVESITFGWLASPFVLDQHFRETGQRVAAEELALSHINNCTSGALDSGKPGSVAQKIAALDVESPEQHGSCPLCA
jgi:hypothetical protein